MQSVTQAAFSETLKIFRGQTKKLCLINSAPGSESPNVCLRLATMEPSFGVSTNGGTITRQGRGRGGQRAVCSLGEFPRNDVGMCAPAPHGGGLHTTPHVTRDPVWRVASDRRFAGYGFLASLDGTLPTYAKNSGTAATSCGDPLAARPADVAAAAAASSSSSTPAAGLRAGARQVAPPLSSPPPSTPWCLSD